ncbi:hypothetical protein [uncultured Draconibacterium sp.]|uniref:hypothetical protein n=1 Tax=uncultured Draconibacterium sp. TaxID=1573823 RepID=UPI0025E0A17A|nr:hypothetical protein [uncultured Draconibacterium sp.]
MKTKRKSIWKTVLIVLVMLLAGAVYRFFFNEPVSDITTTFTAIVGVVVIIFQLRKEHDISRAEFVFNMNSSFAENADIDRIYKKLKANRDSNGDPFTAEEGRLMGDYVMYFEIMSYLIEENIVGIKMIDELFVGRFFLFVNNPDVQHYQLRHSGVMPKIFDLYCVWYNHRKKNGLPLVYPDNQLHVEMPDWFLIDKNGYLALNKKRVKESVPKKLKSYQAFALVVS